MGRRIVGEARDESLWSLIEIEMEGHGLAGIAREALATGGQHTGPQTAQQHDDEVQDRVFSRHARPATREDSPEDHCADFRQSVVKSSARVNLNGSSDVIPNLLATSGTFRFARLLLGLDTSVVTTQRLVGLTRA